MAAPRRGQRPIDVDGVAYEWRIRKRPTYAQAVYLSPMVIAIQARAEGPRRVLVVRLGVPRPDNWLAAHQTGVTPAQVGDVVRRALDAGGLPSAPARPFRFEYAIAADSIGLRGQSPSRDHDVARTPAASKKG